MGLAARVVFEPLPRDRTLNSCSFEVDGERSTCRKVDSPSSRVMPLDSDSDRDILTGI